MRTLRCSCISTKSNKLSLTYWYFTRLKMNIAIIAMVCVLPSFYSSLYLWCKTIKVYIKTGIAIRVCYYQCASKTILTYYGTRNVSIGNGIDSKVYSTFGFLYLFHHENGWDEALQSCPQAVHVCAQERQMRVLQAIN